jgi:hypothetical protein
MKQDVPSFSGCVCDGELRSGWRACAARIGVLHVPIPPSARSVKCVRNQHHVFCSFGDSRRFDDILPSAAGILLQHYHRRVHSRTPRESAHLRCLRVLRPSRGPSENDLFALAPLPSSDSQIHTPLLYRSGGRTVARDTQHDHNAAARHAALGLIARHPPVHDFGHSYGGDTQ